MNKTRKSAIVAAAWNTIPHPCDDRKISAQEAAKLEPHVRREFLAGLLRRAQADYSGVPFTVDDIQGALNAERGPGPRTPLLTCPNCCRPVSKDSDGCLLHDLVQVVRERESVSERKLRKIHARTDVEALWFRLGPIVDDLEEGALCDD